MPHSARAAIVIAIWTLGLVVVAVFAHPTPLYFVETDLVGEYLPAARELAAGTLNLSHYAFKGPGYPLLLAWLSAPFRGDVALAARILSPLAAGAATWFAFLLVRMTLGATASWLTLLQLLVAPVLVRYAVEAGTDAPALALMVASTFLVLRPAKSWSVAMAGFLAGYAVLTRSNAVFLLPCAVAVLALRPRRIQNLVSYAVGAVVPLGAWALIAARAGGLPPDRNYLNVAWELYGHGVAWDQFEAGAGSNFHSLAGVIAHDPFRVVLHTAQNLIVHRWLDIRDLITPWIAVLALPGLVLFARMRSARSWLAHGVAGSLVVALVFYNARFSLYLLPIYLSASSLAFVWLSTRARDALSRSPRWSAARPAAHALGAILLVASGATAAAQTSTHLAAAPHETRLAGEALRRMGLSGDCIMARKPHIAYFAGMTFAPLPIGRRLRELPSAARAAGAHYLCITGIEQVMRPEYAVLGDSGVSLPGFDQVLWIRPAREHFCAVYRLSDAPLDTAAFRAATLAALARYESRRAYAPEALLFTAVQFLELGLPGEALARLSRLERMGARDAAVSKLRSSALLEMGDFEGAAEACETAMKLEPATGWHWARLANIRARQGRLPEARECMEKATGFEPANGQYLESLGRIEVALRSYDQAAATFERGLQLSPADVEMRRCAMGAWQLAGNNRRVQELYSAGLSAGLKPAAMLEGTTSVSDR